MPRSIYSLICLLCISWTTTKTNAEDLLLHNGVIYTVNPQQPYAEAVLIRNGLIHAIGTNARVKQHAGKKTRTIDLQGQFVMPGIHDVHVHPLEASSDFASTCMLDGDETDASAYIGELRHCAPYQLGDTEWVLGAGHRLSTLLNAKRLPKHILDAAIPDTPALIMEETSHSVWVNSSALAAMNIDAATPNPQGGIIVKDAHTGEPTGLLIDAAGDMAMTYAWLPTPAIKTLNYQAVLNGLDTLRKYGITSIAEARTYWKRGFHEAWIKAANQDQLTARVTLGLWAYPTARDDMAQIKQLRSLYYRHPDGLLKLSQIKIYSDGILHNTTAAMLKPYQHTIAGVPYKQGLNYFSQARLARYIKALQGRKGKRGFDFHIHALGDRAVRESLNAIAANPSVAARHRLTHVELVHPKDVARFKQLNVTADIQVAGEFTQPLQWHGNHHLIGPRAKQFIPLRTLHEAGARITLSSDWDVSTLNPFVGMQNALTRAPEQLPNIAEVIKAYTINGAYSLRQESTTGSLAVGKAADLIVLDQDITKVATTKIAQTKVNMTVFAGEIIYQRTQ